MKKTSEQQKKTAPKKTLVPKELAGLVTNAETIKYEFNMIELPLFWRDNLIIKNMAKRYNYNEGLFLEIAPSADPESGEKIPQEYDEKVFIAIMRLFNRQGRKIETTIPELMALAGVKIKSMDVMYARTRESLLRLEGSSIKGKGLLYDADKGNRIDAVEDLRVLKSLLFIGAESFSEKTLAKFSSPQGRKIKEVVFLELSDLLVKNIEKKGYLNFDVEKLLGIENGTARKIYLLIEKWRGWEKTDSLKRSCRMLAGRIPLSWEDKSVSGTLKVIERAAQELKKKGIIAGYRMTSEKLVKDTEIEFIFKEAKKESRSTGHEDLQITGVKYKGRKK